MDETGRLICNGLPFQSFDRGRNVVHSLLSNGVAGHPIKICSSPDASKP
jgi:hypothetical protein